MAQKPVSINLKRASVDGRIDSNLYDMLIGDGSGVASRVPASRSQNLTSNGLERMRVVVEMRQLDSGPTLTGRLIELHPGADIQALMKSDLDKWEFRERKVKPTDGLDVIYGVLYFAIRGNRVGVLKSFNLGYGALKDHLQYILGSKVGKVLQSTGDQKETLRLLDLPVTQLKDSDVVTSIRIWRSDDPEDTGDQEPHSEPPKSLAPILSWLRKPEGMADRDKYDLSINDDDVATEVMLRRRGKDRSSADLLTLAQMLTEYDDLDYSLKLAGGRTITKKDLKVNHEVRVEFNDGRPVSADAYEKLVSALGLPLWKAAER